MILLRNSISKKILIIIPQEMSEVFKICCSIHQRRSAKHRSSFAQTFRNSLVLRRDSFTERTFEQKYVRAMLFHLLLTILQSVSCKAKYVPSQHLDKLQVKRTRRWRSLVTFPQDSVSWTRNLCLFIRETIS